MFLGDLEGHGACAAVMDNADAVPWKCVVFVYVVLHRVGGVTSLHCVGIHFSSNNVFDSPVVATVTVEASRSSRDS